MARDLRTPKYGPRVVRGHPQPEPPEIDEGLEEFWDNDEFDTD